VDGWTAMIDYLNPAYLCMTVHGGIPADLSDGVGKVYNLCRVKFYSNSRVLGHGRLGRPLPSPISVLFFKVDFRKKWRKCQTEYSEGTAVAHAWFGVLVGYCRRWEVVMCD
jgi:hypothetical protein